MTRKTQPANHISMNELACGAAMSVRQQLHSFIVPTLVLAATTAAVTTPKPTEASVPLGVAWNVHPRVGYGVLGLNVYEQLWKRVGETPFYPTLLAAPHSQALLSEYPTAPVFRQLFQTQRHNLDAGTFATGRRARGVAPVPFPVLHALDEGTPEPGQDIWGSVNAAFCFLETARLGSEWVAKARAYDVVLSGSEWNTQLLHKLGVTQAVTAWQGVDVDLFHPRASDGSPSAGVSDPDLAHRLKDKFVIFSGGKLEWRKGQDRVVAAFKRFIREGAHEDAVLLTAWYNQFPETMASIGDEGLVRGVPSGKAGGVEAWLAKNGVPADRVIDMGDSDQARLARAYGRADVGVFPNRVEGGTNLVAMEAMACGMPVVLSNSTGHQDIAGKRDDHRAVHCYAFSATDEDSAVDAIVAELNNVYADRVEARRRGANAALFIRRHFSWTVAVQRVITALINKGAARAPRGMLSWNARDQRVDFRDASIGIHVGPPWMWALVGAAAVLLAAAAFSALSGNKKASKSKQPASKAASGCGKSKQQ